MYHRSEQNTSRATDGTGGQIGVTIIRKMMILLATGSKTSPQVVY